MVTMKYIFFRCRPSWLRLGILLAPSRFSPLVKFTETGDLPSILSLHEKSLLFISPFFFFSLLGKCHLWSLKDRT